VVLVLRKKQRAGFDTQRSGRADCEEEQDDFLNQVNTVGTLYEAAEVAKAQIKKLELVVEAYKTAADDLQIAIKDRCANPDKEDVIGTNLYDLYIGKQSVSRTVINGLPLKNALGADLFMKLATVSLGDIDKYLSPGEGAKIIKVNRGSRKLKFVKR
jgi:hypothetical protein